MKKLIIICSLILLVIAGSSCKNEKSLQGYLVEASEKDGFMTGDLPVSSVLTPKTDVSEEVRATINSVKKINVAFLPKTSENDAAYETEKNRLKNIFSKNKDYKSLMEMKMRGMNVKIFFSGDTDAVDEVIAFGYSKEAGVGVARLLGDNMNPAKVIEMLQNVKMDGDTNAIEQFAKTFSNN